MAAPVFLLPGCQVDAVKFRGRDLIIEAHTNSTNSRCPRCAQVSERVHSYYTRMPRDLPVGEHVVRLCLRVRRFRCFNPACPKRTFAERLPELLEPHAQRTNRLTVALYHVGQALGGAAGARLLKHLFMSVSDDTLIRILRRQRQMAQQSPRVLGIDDWAMRKGHTYGTILVDLERHQVVDLLPDRTAKTLEQWLRAHPGIEVIARDRSTEYARGVAEGAPGALQVADRWHLLMNFRQMLERFLSPLHSHLKELPQLVGAHHGEPLAVGRGRFLRAHSDEEASQASRKRRMARYAQVQRLRQEGLSIRQIANRLGLHRSTVRTYYYAENFPERSQRRPARSILDPHLPYLEKRHQEGCENAFQLWREIRARGYSGSRRQVSRWMQQRRKQPAPTTPKKYLKPKQATTHLAGVPHLEAIKDGGLPSVKQLAWLLIRDPDKLTEKEVATLQRIRQHPVIENVYSLAQQFVAMVRQKLATLLDSWLEGCLDSNLTDLQNFASGIKQDYEAVRGALETAWSSGQTEGQVNRLKMLKRQMYGRAGFDLLRIRVLYPSWEH